MSNFRPKSEKNNSNAFVFYASNKKYLWYAMISIQKLKELKTAENIDFVILITDFTMYNWQVLFHRLNIFLKQTSCFNSSKLYRIGHIKDFSNLHEKLYHYNRKYYLNCMGKLRLFQIYDQYQRVVFMDADGLKKIFLISSGYQ